MSSAIQQTLPPPDAEVVRVIKAGQALPILDVGPYLAGRPGAAEQLAADVRYIQEDLGFYAIVNHGVDQSVIEAAEEQTYRLFALPEDVKLKYRAQGHMQGYWPPATVANVRPGFEEERGKASTISGWAFLQDRAPDDPKVKAGLTHRTTNKWPDPALLPDFRPTLQRYHAAMLALARRMVPIYALALDLPANYFERDFEGCEWYSRCNFYGLGAVEGAGIGTQAHSDHSFLTLLPIAKVPGLQVRTPNQTWIDAVYMPGALIVNTGEWLNHLSNGRFMATPHRVTLPREDRVSLPFFMNPRDDAVDDPTPGSVGPGQPRRFKRSNWHDFFVGYVGAYTKG